MIEQIIKLERMEDAVALFGNFDQNIKLLQEAFGVFAVIRGEILKISGEEKAVFAAKQAVEEMLALLSRGDLLTEQKVRYLISLIQEGHSDQFQELSNDCVCITAKGKPVKAKTLGQNEYLNGIESNTITIGIGPAGTGKTYLAVAMAVRAFRAHEVDRIILTRPAVEAGEKLGFLPGDLQNKVDPYLRPLYDALFDMLGAEGLQKYQERGNIEVAPLAYMRGRTLDDSFIILDEAQNTTPEQMKMFLTRLGFGSKAVITGDITQIDLPIPEKSGLLEVTKVLKNIPDICITRFQKWDVVRHRLVQDIVEAYDQYYSNRKTGREHHAQSKSINQQQTKYR